MLPFPSINYGSPVIASANGRQVMAAIVAVSGIVWSENEAI